MATGGLGYHQVTTGRTHEPWDAGAAVPVHCNFYHT